MAQEENDPAPIFPLPFEGSNWNLSFFPALLPFGHSLMEGIELEYFLQRTPDFPTGLASASTVWDHGCTSVMYLLAD